MLLGKYPCPMDKQNRFKVPGVFMGMLSGDLYMIQGFERNLLCLTDKAFQEICSKISAQNIANPLTRLLLRLVMGSAHMVRVDKNGAIRIPDLLAVFADVDQEVFVVGQGDYFEIWKPQNWQAQEAQLQDIEQNTSRFSTLPIHIR